ncbi:MAG: AAA family ATPase [Pseudomonadales bacterium]
MKRAKLVLIGGTSHAGKSTLGRRLAEELDWNHLSTDQLARHPGRPWNAGGNQIPDDVVDHYTRLSVAELVDSVLSHYRSNVWPIIDAIIRSRLNNPFDPGLVFEGSAILPESVRAAGYPRVAATWLTAPNRVITERIKRSSDYETRTTAEQRLVDAFIQRSIAIDEILRADTDGESMLDATSGDVAELLGLLA